MDRHARLDPVSPTVLLDDVIPFRVRGLEPGSRAGFVLELVDDVGTRWVSSADIGADHEGVADASVSPSRSGSYTGVDGDGLLWSLAPEGVSSDAERAAFMREARHFMHGVGQPGVDRLAPRRFRLSARLPGGKVVETAFEQVRLSSDVRMERISDGHIRGIAFHAARNVAPKGAILCLTGSNGGADLAFAPLLASRGFNVLSAAYFAWEGRPDVMRDIDLEYFKLAATWMRDNFAAEQIACQGVSRGGELTLVLLSQFSDVFCGGVALVPMHVVVSGFDHVSGTHGGASWRLAGEPLPHCDVKLAYTGPESISTARGAALEPHYRRDAGLSNAADPRCIPVERIKGRLLMITGRDDEMWPCSWAGDRVVDRMRAHGRGKHVEHLALENVGHYMLAPRQPTMLCTQMYHPLLRQHLACGGQPRAISHAASMSWARMLRFYGELFA